MGGQAYNIRRRGVVAQLRLSCGDDPLRSIFLGLARLSH
jgi:hypothetical protein